MEATYYERKNEEKFVVFKQRKVKVLLTIQHRLSHLQIKKMQ